MSKKPNYQDKNLPKLVALCDELGLEIEKIDTYQYRVYAAIHIIDIWPARMVYHLISGEVINAHEPYHHELNMQFNRNEVEQLLMTGDFNDISTNTQEHNNHLDKEII